MVREFDQRAVYQVFGQVTAPAAGAVIAVTAPLFEWSYIVSVIISVADTLAVGKRIDVQLRDPDDAYTWIVFGSVAAGGSLWAETRRTLIGQNFKIRAVAGIAGAAGSVYTASISMWMVP